MLIFSNRLLTLRKNHKLTQKQLADAIDANVRSIQFYEANQRTPDIDALIKLAKFFNTSIDYLVGLSDDPAPSRHRGGVSEIEE